MRVPWNLKARTASVELVGAARQEARVLRAVEVSEQRLRVLRLKRPAQQ